MKIFRVECIIVLRNHYEVLVTTLINLAHLVMVTDLAALQGDVLFHCPKRRIKIVEKRRIRSD